jgi:hypothetical protein
VPFTRRWRGSYWKYLKPRGIIHEGEPNVVVC